MLEFGVMQASVGRKVHAAMGMRNRTRSGSSDEGHHEYLVVRLDAAEATSGVIKTVAVRAEPGAQERTIQVRFPPGVGNGARLRVPVPNPDGGSPSEVFVRARVRSLTRRANRVIGLVVAVMVIGGAVAVAAFSGSGGDTTPTGPGSSTALLTTTSAEVPPTFHTTTTVPTTANPFEVGTCLTGTLPDSTIPVRVGSDVTEVSCFSPAAHYKVIEYFPATTDMTRCDANPHTEYGFSFEETINGISTNQYVYCLVGMVSFAR